MEDLNENIRYKNAKKRVEEEKGFYGHLTAYIIVNIALLLINADFKDEGLNAFLKWHLYLTPILWGIGLGVHAIKTFRKDFIFGKKWEERKIQELLDKEDF